MNKISVNLRKKFFDILIRNSSSEFVQYLRAYEDLSRSSSEAFEISCELVNGIKVDNVRLSIEGLRRINVLKWLEACHRPIPFIEDLLYKNSTEHCFGIGLADYPSGGGTCRIKIYNFYGRLQSQAKKLAHIRKVFSLLNIPDDQFKKDYERFKRVEFSGIDWDQEGKVTFKVYFGLFPLDHLFDKFFQIFKKDEMKKYEALRKRGLLPEKFICCAKYSQKGSSLRTDMRYQTRKISPFLKIFDVKQEVLASIADFYKVFNDIKLEYIAMQWVPVQKIQFYFNFNSSRYGVRQTHD